MTNTRVKDFGTLRTWPSADDYVGIDGATGGTAKMLANAIGGLKANDVASASTTNIASILGDFCYITGTTTITALGTAGAGQKKLVIFTGTLTLTHNATSLILMGGANIVTQANDVAEFMSLGSGNWICISYFPAAAKPDVYASSTDVITGTDLFKIVTPGTLRPRENFIVAVSDETTALTTGTGKVTFRMPYAAKLAAVRASVTTAPTGANLIVDIKEGGTTILSTLLSIDAGAKTSTTATTPAVISDTNLADDAEMKIDVTQVGSTIAGAGLKVAFLWNRV